MRPSIRYRNYTSLRDFHSAIKITVKQMQPARRKGATHSQGKLPTYVSGNDLLPMWPDLATLWLARPEGLEPPAYGFEANRSIQLSYGRALVTLR